MPACVFALSTSAASVKESCLHAYTAQNGYDTCNYSVCQAYLLQFSLNVQFCILPTFEKYISDPEPSFNPHYFINNAMQELSARWPSIQLGYHRSSSHPEGIYTSYFKQDWASNGNSITFTKVVEIVEELDNLIIPVLDSLKVKMLYCLRT